MKHRLPPRMSRVAFALAVVHGLCLAQIQFARFDVSPAPSGYPMVPQRLAIGADGNIWYTEYQPNNSEHRLGRITPNGVITEFRATPSPTGWVGPKMGFGITSSGGKLWIVQDNGKIGRMDPLNPYPAGPYDEFTGYQHPYTGMNMITGSDGNVWYTQYNSIGKMNPAGVNAGAWLIKQNPGWTEQPNRIAVGPDGNLWVTVAWNGIVRMTTAGVVVGSYAASVFNTERGVTTGPDGRVWFSDTGRIAAVGMSGTESSYTTSTVQNMVTEWLAAGPDGAIWATGSNNNGRGLIRMNTGGNFAMIHFPDSFNPTGFPSTSFLANDIIVGPDGCLWVAGGIANVNGNISQGSILRACLPGPRPVSASSPLPSGVYVTGNTLTITVMFDAPVIVTGNPTLALNSGGTAVYTSGSGTNVLTFTYTVQASEATPQLDGKSAVANLLPNVTGSAMALRLNGGTIRDASGNNAILLLPLGTSPGSLASNKTIVINPADTIPPVTSAIGSPGPNAHGWNNTAVNVAISATDAGSGVKEIHYSLSGAQTGAYAVTGDAASIAIHAEGATTIAFYAVDHLGNIEEAQSLTVRVDLTSPTVTFGAASPPANAAGWNKSSVAVAFVAADSGSGLASGASESPLVLNTEGPNVTGTIAVSDLAGNTTTVVSPAFKIDRTPPSIAGVRTPLPNSHNWNNSDVTVSFSCTDTGSGVAPGSPTEATTFSADGVEQSVAGTCVDLAGNSASVTVGGINIDKTPPSVAASPAPGPTWYNSALTVGFSGADGLSGIAGCTGPVTVTPEGAGQTAVGACTDMAGNTNSVMAGPYNIDSVKPAITKLIAEPSVVAVSNEFSLQAVVSDSGSGAVSVEFNVDGGPYSPLTGSAAIWTVSVAPLAPGIHTVCGRVADRAGNQSDTVCVLVPVFDPTGSFVTGGGFIASPAGAYPANPSLSGKANFALNARYQKNSNVPTGDAQFQLGNLSFKSTEYEWLVVTGSVAQLKGTGTINGSGGYGFLLTAIDGDIPTKGGDDKFRIQIWSRNADGSPATVIYDNQMGAEDTSAAATPIGGGSIVIHK